MNIISLIREILKSKNIIWDLAKADFRKRFVGSYFGVAWMFVQPVVTVLIYFLCSMACAGNSTMVFLCRNT